MEELTEGSQILWRPLTCYRTSQAEEKKAMAAAAKAEGRCFAFRFGIEKCCSPAFPVTGTSGLLNSTLGFDKVRGEAFATGCDYTMS